MTRDPYFLITAALAGAKDIPVDIDPVFSFSR